MNVPNTLLVLLAVLSTTVESAWWSRGHRLLRRLTGRNASPLRFLAPNTTGIGGYPGCRSLSRSELELWAITNREREVRGKNRIRLSRLLTAVAFIHAKNANRITGNTTECNLHSWLAPPLPDEHYTSCCYKRDHTNDPCMYWKPKQVSENRFPSIGYEVAIGPRAEFHDPEDMMRVWFESYGHRIVILEEGMWNGYDFQAYGVGVRGDWGMMWFGSHDDPLGYCGVTRKKTDFCYTRMLDVVVDTLVPRFLRQW